MLIGHVGLALIGKGLRPRLSLAAAVAASLLSDLLLFTFVLAGIEQVTFRSGPEPAPYFVMRDVVFSHSIAMSVVWGALFALFHWWWVRDKVGAAVIGVLVVGHLLLDVIASPSALPLAPGQFVYVGSRTARFFALTMAFEAAMWVCAVVLYVSDSRSTNAVGRYCFWGGVVSWTLAWYVNITAPRHLDPETAGIEAMILLLLMIAWGYVMNRTRVMKAA